MKTKIIIGVISLILGLMAYVLWDFDSPSTPTKNPARSTEKNAERQGNRKQVPLVSSSQADEAEIDYSSLLNEKEKAHMIATGHVLTEADREKLKRRKLAKDITQLMPTMEELKVMMDTPVEFYGQVLDQSDQPVVGAKISCSWAYMGPPDSPVELQSAAPNGQFEVVGLKAFSIAISVYPPPGYDEQVREFKNIQIAKAPERVLKNEDYSKFDLELKKSLEGKHGAVEAYKGDKTKPMIFRLKKL